MLSLDQRRRFRHSIFVQRVGVMPDVPRQEWQADRLAKNTVTVSLGPRGLARMEIRRHFARIEHPNRCRQNVIQGNDEVGTWDDRIRLKCRYLGQRMYSGV